MCDAKGIDENTTVTTGDGLSLGGEVPEGSDEVLESGMGTTTAANDNETLTVENYGGTHKNPCVPCESNGIREYNRPKVRGPEHKHSEEGNDTEKST